MSINVCSGSDTSDLSCLHKCSVLLIIIYMREQVVQILFARFTTIFANNDLNFAVKTTLCLVVYQKCVVEWTKKATFSINIENCVVNTGLWCFRDRPETFSLLFKSFQREINKKTLTLLPNVFCFPNRVLFEATMGFERDFYRSARDSFQLK